MADFTSTRRSFVLGFVAALAARPLPALPGIEGAVVKARWWAAGGNDHHYAFWARTADEALAQFAAEHGATIGDFCPECDLVNCLEHNDEADLDKPQPHLTADTFASWEQYGPESEPPIAAWSRVGYLTHCEECDWAGEPTETYEHDGRALCCNCLEDARIAKLDRIIGIEPGHGRAFDG